MATSASACELRILMFGKSQKEKTKLNNLIAGKKDSPFCQFKKISPAYHRGTRLTVVETPNVFSLPVNTVIQEIKKSEAQCQPGPNVLLLLVNPSDFTERDRHRFNIIVKSFGEDAFKHLLIILTQNDTGNNPSVRKLSQECGHRQHVINVDGHFQPLEELIEKLENIVREDRDVYLNFTEETDQMEEFESLRLPLSVALCGRHKALKTSAANAILGKKSFHRSSFSECIKNEGKVCGRWVSLVKLPPLYGASKETAAKESSKCITLCGPEGVNAFALVLPLAPPSEEDMKELNIIQKTFSTRINDITVILLVADTEPDTTLVRMFLQENTDIQQLIQSCGGRYIVFNITDKQQVSEVLHAVESMGAEGGRTFTKGMVHKPQSAAKQLQKCLKVVQGLSPAIPPRVKSNTRQSRECIRMVLVGKTGCGKSASANTILGRECFHSEVSSSSLTTLCQKETGDIDGKPVVVVDTPGLFDTTLSNDEVRKEILKCISLSAPGPHVFLLVLQIGRFTQEEKETVRLIQQFFGKRSGKFTIVLFTRGDALKSKTIEDFVEQDKEGSMKKLINECGGGCHAFNNNDEKNRSQVKELLKKIEMMVKKNGRGFYTTEMFQEAEAAIQKEQEKIMKEKEPEMLEKQRDLERQYQEEMQKRRAKVSQLMPKFDDEDERVKLLQEKEEQMKMEQEKRKKEKREELIQKRQHNLEQRVGTLEGQIKCVSETAVVAAKTLVRKSQQEFEAWEQERKELSEKQYHEIDQRLEEEKAKRQACEQECKRHENEMSQAKIRREQEERKLKEFQESFEMKLEEMRRKNEAQARKQAEESNEFIEKYARRQKRQQAKMIKQLCQTKANQRSYDELKKKQDEEMNELKSKHVDPKVQDKEINELKEIHEEETSEWIEEHVKQATEHKTCTIS